MPELGAPRRLTRSLGLLIVAALLPVILFGAIGTVASLLHDSRALDEALVQRARILSAAIDRELQAQTELVRTLAVLPALDEGPEETGELRSFADIAVRVQEAQPLWRAVNLADPDGNRLVDTSRALGPVTDLASLKLAVARAAPVVGDIVLGPRGNGAFAVRAPVLRDGRVRFVVSAVIDAGAVQRLLLRPSVPEGAVVTVVDRAGRVLARTAMAEAIGHPASVPALAARRAGGEGSYDGLTLEHMASVSAYHMSPVTGWSVHIGVPRDAYRAPLMRKIWLSVAGAVVCLVLAGAFVLLLLRELRMQRRDTLAMEQGRRMEALGRLTGSVAHDFNNLLTVIVGNTQILERRVPEVADSRWVAAVHRAAERATQLTRELLAFSRGGSSQPTVLDANACVRGFMGMLRETLGPAIVVEVDLAEGLPNVEVDRLQFDLALLNAAVNARDAMPEGGTVRLLTRPVMLPSEARPEAMVPGIAVSVADTGTGIPETALPHVFDPFFTTKEYGKGTGLGLSQIYAFARRAGGTAEIESRPGQGTRLTLKLPGTAKPVSIAAAVPETVDEDPANPRRVLLVDDNAEVRGVAAAYLAECGYAVAEAGNAAEGLAVLHAGGVDVLVSDIVMPGEMDGVALARTARQRWPELPVLLVSGYPSRREAAAAAGMTALAKPYELRQLAAAVADAWGAGRSQRLYKPVA